MEVTENRQRTNHSLGNYPTPDREGLRYLLDYELSSAKRYRRFVSLVVMSLPSNGRDITKLFHQTLRESDRMFALDPIGTSAAVLMSETDGISAMTALERYRRVSGAEVDIRAAIVTFPFDAGSASEILNSANRRVTKALEGGHGSVVSTD